MSRSWQGWRGTTKASESNLRVWVLNKRLLETATSVLSLEGLCNGICNAKN